MAIRCVKDRITCTELKAIAGHDHAGMIKVVADLKLRLLGFGGTIHHDIEKVLLAEGSSHQDMWGFNLYLDKPWAEAFEFRSHVNIRPKDGNPSIKIHDQKICQALFALALERIDWDH
jgi:hypothetical protein